MSPVPPNRLKELREARGLRRVDLAAHCDVGEMTIRRWELGLSNISDPQKFRLAELLEVDVVDLMGWDREGAAA